MSVAVGPVYKQYGSVAVPLFLPNYCSTVSTIYKYRLYQSNYKYLFALSINKLSLYSSMKYCFHNREVRSQCCHFCVTSHGGAAVGAVFKVKCFKLVQSAGSRSVVDRTAGTC